MKLLERRCFGVMPKAFGVVFGFGLTGAFSSVPAMAQSSSSAEDAADLIIVTGSRIAQPNTESSIPITTFKGEELFQTGDISLGDNLNDLPQLRSSVAQQNPGNSIGIAGLNLLDLRGLGTRRTLVLVNGRRHVASDILDSTTAIDINTISADLIDRVEVVTGSNSAVYGSDAIAGVVNFVLKKKFEGFQLRGQAGVAGQGFGRSGFVSGIYGQNFAEGRGNVLLQAEHSRQARIFASDISAFRQVDGLAVLDIDPGTLPSGSDGVADRSFVRDVRSTAVHRFGLIPITQSGANPLCGVGIGSTNGPASTLGTDAAGALRPSNNGTPYNCNYIFSPSGQLTAQTGTRISQGPSGIALGGNSQTGREDQLLSVLPMQQRLSLNLLAHFSVSEGFEPFIEAKWSRLNSQGTGSGPTTIQGQFTAFDIRERIRLDNPYLSASDRTTLANAILASRCNTSLTVACNAVGIPASALRTTFGGQGTGGPLNAADIAQISAGTYRFLLGRQLLDAGIRDEKFQRDTYRIVGGARGTFNSDWTYEFSVNYGLFKEKTDTSGYVDKQRFMLSLDAGRNPATGNIECRAQYDAASAVPFSAGLSAATAAANRAKLAADIAACVPYNPFGAADNSAAARYFVYNAQHRASMSQLDIMGFVKGDTSGFLTLPGGAANFLIGGEYRRETAEYITDPYVETGATNAVLIPRVGPLTSSVKEAFAELSLPLFKDAPLIGDLSLKGASRLSDYSTTKGSVWTWNIGGEWSPMPGIRFRAALGKATRAPNFSETSFPAVANFAPAFLDPCALLSIGNNAARTANCSADLGTLLAGLPNVPYALPIISKSNANLTSESSKSWTWGAVLQPGFIPNLTLSIDYYRIRVDSAIVSLSAQSVANGCYDQPTLQNQFCAVFSRWRGPGLGPRGEVPGQILADSLIAQPYNFAMRLRRGIDVNLDYRIDLANRINVQTSMIYTHGLQSSNFENPSIPSFENRLLGELGDPQDELRIDTAVRLGAITIGHRLRYIGALYVNTYEDFNALPGACTLDGCPPNNADYADVQKYDAVFYHDIRFAWDIGRSAKGLGKGMQFYAGLDNAFNRMPPLGSTGTGSGSAIYDIRGRYFYAGFKANF